MFSVPDVLPSNEEIQVLCQALVVEALPHVDSILYDRALSGFPGVLDKAFTECQRVAFRGGVAEEIA